MSDRTLKTWRHPLVPWTLAAAGLTACADVESTQPLAADRATESTTTVTEATQITRVVPLRFIEALGCRPGPGCAPNVAPGDLRSAIDRANTVYADAGIKFWIKSVELYDLPKFTQLNNDSFSWSQVRSAPAGTSEDGLLTVFPSASLGAYDSANDVKTTGGWMASLSAFYGDPNEIILWVVNAGPAGAQSATAFPESGRSSVIVASNITNTDGTATWATTHLAHEIGHFFGVRHPEAPTTGTNPATGQPWTQADQWDLLYCGQSGGTPTRFFTSAQDFTNVACPQDRLHRILQTTNCTSDGLYGVVSCTVDGATYQSGDPGVSNVLWVDNTVAQSPPDSIAYGTNVLSYYSYYPPRSTRAPSRFSPSQLTQVSAYAAHDLAYDASAQAALLRANGQAPGGGLAGGLSSLRTQLGTASDSFLWWANGDLSFASQPRSISGTNFTPVSGDFNNDGFDDICWYDPATGNANFWWSNGNRTFASQNNVALGAGFQIFTGNFDGAWGDDIVLYAPGAGADRILWSNGDKTFTAQAVSVSGTYTPVVGNFDASGGDDIFWYSSSAGVVNIWWANGGTRTFTSQNGVAVGTGLTAIPGNYDDLPGDDLVWYAPGVTSPIWFSNADRTFTTSSTFVHDTYLPIPGDFNGDGIGDIFWEAVNATTDYVWTGRGLRSNPFDTTGRESVYGSFRPVAGNFDGVSAGKRTTDIFWYRH